MWITMSPKIQELMLVYNHGFQKIVVNQNLKPKSPHNPPTKDLFCHFCDLGKGDILQWLWGD